MIFHFAGLSAWYFFFDWNNVCMYIYIYIYIYISQKNTIKSLLEAKIWFMLPLRNTRRNIVSFYIQQRWWTKNTYGYSCSLLEVPSLRSKWKQILDFIYICKTFLGQLYTLRYLQLHLRCAWNIIYMFIYMS